ncbi:amino acid adenylation domain-containing protein [Micromonospora sp. DT228]|uniref:amino acid adenylation domain-containing protein n=1 Tax=Micromonospora sp. DT228 TaxID=3393443 RepID=UPI003CF7C50A
MADHTGAVAALVTPDGILDPALFGTAVRRALDELQTATGLPAPEDVELVDLGDEPDPERAAEGWIGNGTDATGGRSADRGSAQALLHLGAGRCGWYQRYPARHLDRHGVELVTTRAAEIYSGLLGGGAPGEPLRATIPPGPESPGADAARRHWAGELRDAPQPASLSTALDDRRVGRVTAEAPLDAGETAAVRASSRAVGVAWPVWLAAAVTCYLHRRGAGTDVLTGVRVAGRTERGDLRDPGPLARVLPLRVPVRPEQTVAAVVRRVADATRRARRHLRHPVTDVGPYGVLIEAVPAAPPARFGPVPATVRHLGTGQPAQLVVRVVEDPVDHGLRLLLDGDAAHFDAADLTAHLAGLRRALTADPRQPVAGVDLVGDPVRRAVAGWNDTATPVVPATVPELFEATADRDPEAVAVVAGPTRLTYRDLDERANRLAHHLLAAGAGPGRLVALALPRTADTVVALLAITKTGAAYLPVDPAYPAARVAGMLADARPALLVTSGDLAARHPDHRAVRLDDPAVRADVDGRPARRPGDADRSVALLPAHPAYVIYTSGSTGRPKGVVVAHRSVANLLAWARRDIGDRALRRVLASTSLSFDVSVFEVVVPLLAGHTVELVADPLALIAEPSARWQVSLVSTVPSVLGHLVAHGGLDLSPDTLLLAGEALPVQVARAVRERFPDARLGNVYGPTEATVYATAWYGRGPVDGPPPIGRPLPNTRAYVLDGAMQPVPPGTAGELYLAGHGIADGYLGNPALTAERFPADPFGPPGTRLYRTGDLARWDSDGVLHYLGRTDHQVKVRGFRIEPGDVEATLTGHPSVTAAAVVAREDRPGDRKLVAYVTGAVDGATVRAWAAARMPDHMVPSAVVVLDRLPTTPNGKLDRAALPAPDFAAAANPTASAATVLAGVFADVLGLPSVDHRASLFDIGGDSIIAIQLVSRARRAGLSFTPQDVFEHPTVEALAAICGRVDDGPAEVADDGVGRVPLTPIMEWFRQRGGPGDGFSQSVGLQVPADLGHDRLVSALRTVLDHHDTLRLTLTRRGGGTRVARWTLDVRPRGAVDAASCVRRVDVEGLDERGLAEAVRREAEAARRELAPTDGVMLRLVWLDAGPRHPGRLLVVAHHLVVDGVAWRVLVPDLVAAWSAARAGTSADLSPVGTSYRRWAQLLTEEARRPEREDEVDVWLDQLAGEDPTLGTDRLVATRDVTRTSRMFAMRLPAEQTELLLTRAPALFHCGPDEVLMTGLALAVAAWRRGRGQGDASDVLLDIEGHGREPVVPGVDLSRTVGWFTSIYPVRLDPGAPDWDEVRCGGPAVGVAIRRVRQLTRSLPDKGVGFGLLRYLNPHTSTVLAEAGRPQIGFNYLGRFAAVGGEGADTGWGAAKEFDGLGGGADPDSPLPHELEIGMVAQEGPTGTQLTASLMFAGELFGEEEIAELANRWAEALVGLAAHTALPGSGDTTHPDLDLSLAPLTPEELDVVVAAVPDPVDLLPVAPLQEGMLFHARFDENALDVYSVQLILDVEGPLAVARLGRAADDLLRRHPNLRAGFLHDGLTRPVQVIPRGGHPPVDETDLRGLDPAAQEDESQRLLAADRARRFDLARPPLVRISVHRLTEERHRISLLCHHIVADGWSTPLLIRDLLSFYAGGDAARDLPPLTPYREYVTWLVSRDTDAAATAWREAYTGFETPTLVAPGSDGRDPVPASEVAVDLPDALSDGLAHAARRCGVTLNTVVQAAWGLALAATTGSADVAFGATVSVRPPELDDIEAMVGLSMNVVPVRVRCAAGSSLREVVTRLRVEQTALMPHQHLGLRAIHRAVGHTTLFDTVFAFENYPMDTGSFQPDGSDLRVVGLASHDGSHYPVTLRVYARGGRVQLRLDHRPDVVDDERTGRLLTALRRVFEALVSDVDTPVGRLRLADPSGGDALAGWNDTAAALPALGPDELVAAVAASSPDAVAVLDGDTTLTYRELDSRADRLAAALVATGVAPGDRVAVAVPRGAALVVSLLATLRAGAAYLPVDVDYPSARLAAILADARPTCLVAADDAALPDFPGPRLRPDGPGGSTTPRVPAAAGRPAYVMYTSGTTGVPRGVVVSGGAIVALALDRRFDTAAHRRVLLHSPVTFDAATYELWVPLLRGGTVVVAPPGDLDVATIGQLVARHRVTALWLTASLFRLVAGEAPEALAGVAEVWTGGEVVPTDAVARVRAAVPGITVVDGYGPTENTTFATTWPVRPGDPVDGPLPIGRPMDNTRAYVLDPALRPVGPDVPGELYLAGAGLAHGYLDDAALTASRFPADPFGPPGGRLYRTGDLARWDADGVLHFLGRADDQVKVRGFRIEPGDVEAALREHPAVAEAVVVAREDHPGVRRLVAYVTGAEADGVAVREWAATRLPDHMLPAAVVVVRRFPLTANGKLDRASLPAPGPVVGGRGGAPRTDAERVVARLFTEVLRLDEVGVEDRFFDLGGDSISALQLASRARRAGLALTPRQVFAHKSVAAIAAVAQAVTAPAVETREEAIGAMPLTPIMRWCHERPGPVDGFSQSITLAVPGGLAHADLVVAVQALLDHHDALRMRVDTAGGCEILPVGSVDASTVVDQVRVADLDDTEAYALLDAAREDARRALVPANGQMFRVVHADAGGERTGRLFLLAHHFVVDGVTWRVLGADLEAAWRAVRDGTPAGAALAPVGTSLRRWAGLLAEEAQRPDRENEVDHWLAQLGGREPSLGSRPLDPAVDVIASAAVVPVELPPEESAALLVRLPALFHCTPDVVLATALALATTHRRRARGRADGGSALVIDSELHGREPLVDGLDLTRTAGWFTSMFPVRLDPGAVDWQQVVSGGPALESALKRVKEQLRSMPDHGIGYGLLRFLNPHTRPLLAAAGRPEVGFNYLGRFAGGADDPSAGSDAWSPAPESGGLDGGADPRTALDHVLEVTAWSVDGPQGPSLSASLMYGSQVVDAAEVEELARAWRQALGGLAALAGVSAGGRTPSDFPLLRLTQHEVDAITAEVPSPSEVLPLAPLQEGLLFHAVSADEARGVYVVQFTLHLDGPLDGAALRRAGDGLLRRHPHLGAAFLHEGLPVPVQVIGETTRMPWREIDLSQFAPAEQESRLVDLVDAYRAARFQPTQPPMVRLLLVRLAAERHALVIGAHHILLDGWSTPLLITDLLALYHAEVRGTALAPPPPYRDYLAWIARQDRTAARVAWRDVLDDLSGPSILAEPAPEKEAVLPEHVISELSEPLSTALRAQARAGGLTVNTFVQTAWALTLADALGRDDVVFGMTVAGRPPELPGVEKMVGLFINTLPVRVRLRADEDLAGLLARVQDEQSHLSGFQYLSLGEIQRAAGVGELFDSAVVFENFPLDMEALTEANGGLRMSGATGHDTPHFTFGLAVLPYERIAFRVTHRPDLLPRAEVERLVAAMVRALQLLVDHPERRVAAVRAEPLVRS